MSNCIAAKPYTAIRNLRDRVKALEENSGGGSVDLTKTAHTVNTTSFLNAGDIRAESVGGILKVGGYFQTKNQHPGDGATTSVICTIQGVTVAGFSYMPVIDHNNNGKAYNILLLTENGQTKVQFEGSSYALPASTWINFTVYGILG